MGHLVFVTGGARSGKSQFAERRVAQEAGPVTYIATMHAGDAELEARIARHRERRPASWTTVEAPSAPATALRDVPPGAAVLLDCLSLWVSNIIAPAANDKGELPGGDVEGLIQRVVSGARELVTVQRERRGVLVVVTNEVGLGIVPLGALSRSYRDALGLANQEIAAGADEAYLLVSGIPMQLK